MHFFEQQDQARTSTSRWVLVFALCVFGLGIANALVVHLILGEVQDSDAHWSLVATAAIGTWGVILLASTFRLTFLRQGGKVVAEGMGGTLIVGHRADELEQRAQNVVEEMAIAAGLPVPPLYVLRREDRINAFAAGWSSADAVIGLTRGAIERLNRSQLQGVIGHEMSHILNRDSALNMRLLGVLHGIVALSSLGRFLLHIRQERNRRSGSPFFLLGLALFVLGSLGAFCARWIQARVSREREFLADASAVQFTRDPFGIAGALAVIHLAGSQLESPQAGEATHLFIAATSTPSWLNWATHPSLRDRVQRIIPSWDGDWTSLAGTAARARAPESIAGGASPQPSELPFSALVGSGPGFSPALPTGDAPASGLLERAAREPQEAQLLLLAGALDDDLSTRATQLALLGAEAPDLCARLPQIARAFSNVPPQERMTLVQVALGSLGALSQTQAQTLRNAFELLQGQLTPWAHRPFCTARRARQHLAGKPPKKGKAALPVDESARILLGVVARRGMPGPERAEAAFRKGLLALGQDGNSPLLPLPSLTVSHLDRALESLVHADVTYRKALVRAAQEIALYDGILVPMEAELLSTFAVCLEVGAPTPPGGSTQQGA